MPGSLICSKSSFFPIIDFLIQINWSCSFTPNRFVTMHTRLPFAAGLNYLANFCNKFLTYMDFRLVSRLYDFSTAWCSVLFYGNTDNHSRNFFLEFIWNLPDHLISEGPQS